MKPAATDLELGDWLAQTAQAAGELMAAVNAAASAVGELDALISQWSGAGASASVRDSRNADGDRQHTLDLLADEVFAHALEGAGVVRWLASEERAAAVALTERADLAVAIDPLDGSSNIAVDGPLGAIISIYRAESTPEASFLRPGRDQLAAAYALFGPQTMLALTLGAGTHFFRLDRARQRFTYAGAATVAPQSDEYAINASNRRHWPPAINAYIKDCEQGSGGPLGRDMNTRWTAALVADAHRILCRGGVFLYPEDERAQYKRGRLRHVYECAPIAFLIEQAGGLASNGLTPTLDDVAADLHARAPFIFGSAESVRRVHAYASANTAAQAPLFAERGLLKG
jgi:fructose-1,6-bisphosphatase I